MSTGISRLRYVLLISLAWGAVTFACAESLQVLRFPFAVAVRAGLKGVGIPCVREGGTLYTPHHQAEFGLADTGIFWWGVVAGLGALAVASPTRRCLLVVGGLAVCILLHGAYKFAQLVAETSHVRMLPFLVDATAFVVFAGLLYTFASSCLPAPDPSPAAASDARA